MYPLFSLTNKFSGLISRWTIFLTWRYSRAEAISRVIALLSFSENLVTSAMASNKSPPYKNYNVMD